MFSKSAVLTLDDAPSVHMEERLAFLESKGIRAVWFCRGDLLERRPQPAMRALRDGHVLGNHSWDHPRFSTLPLSAAFEQIDRTERVLDRLHREAGVPRRIKCFRFPYEVVVGDPAHHVALQAGLKERGFVPPRLDGVVSDAYLEHASRGDVSWIWTWDAEDWRLVAPEAPEADARLAAALSRMDGGDPPTGSGLDRPGTEIVLLHDHDRTAGQWRILVEGLLAKGLRFSLPTG